MSATNEESEDEPIVTAFTVPGDNGILTVLSGDRLIWVNLAGDDVSLFASLPAKDLPTWIRKLSAARISRFLRRTVWRKRLQGFRRATLSIYPPHTRSSPFNDRIYALWVIKQILGPYYQRDVARTIYQHTRFLGASDDASVRKHLI